MGKDFWLTVLFIIPLILGIFIMLGAFHCEFHGRRNLDEGMYNNFQGITVCE